jgi:hypothetical protein
MKNLNVIVLNKLLQLFKVHQLNKNGSKNKRRINNFKFIFCKFYVNIFVEKITKFFIAAGNFFGKFSDHFKYPAPPTAEQSFPIKMYSFFLLIIFTQLIIYLFLQMSDPIPSIFHVPHSFSRKKSSKR